MPESSNTALKTTSETASVSEPDSTASKTPLLDLVKTPADLRRLDSRQLHQLADELRQETIDAVAITGGHSAPVSAWSS